jgi:hypothetical protein
VSIALYFDHNVRAAIATGLWLRGVDVRVALQDGFAEAEDAAILARATELGRVAFSHDDDFLAVAHDWLKTGQEFTGVIYVHQLKLTIGQTIAELDLIAKVGNPEDFRNRVEYLPL